MPMTADVLRELHRIHRQFSDLRDRLQSGPRQIRIGTQAVEQAEQTLAQARELAKRTRMEADEKQLSLRQREAKIADLQRKLNAAQTNTEYTALRDQISADKAANAVLEDEILDRLERLDEHQKQIGECDQKLARARDELQKISQRVTGEQSILEAELMRVKTDLRQAEQALPSDFRSEYDRLVKARGEESLAPVVDQSCGGCHTTLTIQTIDQLYLAKPAFCKSCGCMLYLPKGFSLPRAAN